MILRYAPALVAGTVALVCARASLAQSTLVMRAGAAAPQGQVAGVGLEGVRIALAAPTGMAPGSAERLVSWDVVARIEGPLSAEAAPFMPLAESMWRARTRLERGDSLGAEPLFEELFAKYAGQRGPSAAVVCGGLLRCRLMEGAQTGAVAPFLAYVHALPEEHAAGLAMPSFEPAAAAAVDASTQVAPLLPPVWVNVTSVQALANASWPLSNQEGVRARALVLQSLYQQAARFEAGLPAETPVLSAEKDDGVALVGEVVAARIGNENQRAAARQALAARLKKRPVAWIEVWCRVGIGRSLLREGSRDAQLLGVSELLEVPARLERVNAYLTGIALAEAAVALHTLGDHPGATRLRTELNDHFAGHPALEWEQLRSWPNYAPPKAAPVLPLPKTTSDDLESPSINGGPS
ncbi:MAG TPA: hypothetical protein VD997_14160 [Phycisphaerales bacterium]|nr:hypothetical protein [Phycisphaerales bacterium]